MAVLSFVTGLAQGQETSTVTMETNMGQIVLALDPVKAPNTVSNFLTYVEEGAYAGTIFHRVIKRFMIQGGGYTERYVEKPSHAPIQNESDNGLKNLRGTIAMARTSDPHSATSQFFINVVDNDFLDYQKPRWGYTVFGKVIEGMEVVDKIQNVATGRGGPFPQDVPQKPIIIEKVTVPKPAPKASPETNEKAAKTEESVFPPDAPTEPDTPAKRPQ